MPLILADARSNSGLGVIRAEARGLINDLRTAAGDRRGTGNYAYAKIRIESGDIPAGGHVRDAGDNLKIVWVRSDRQLQIARADAHSEPLLEELLAGFRGAGVEYVVLYLFTEREPCESCQRLFPRICSYDKVYWVTPYDSNRAIQLNARDTVRAFAR